MKKISNAFTLVELIIVISILAILATIAFISFQNYIKDSRDSVRLSSLKNIENGLQVFQITTGNYPQVENIIPIQASGTTILLQGYIGDMISSQIKINKTPLDPLDQTKYIYASNSNKTRYQLLTHLESQNSLSYINHGFASNYAMRTPKVFGNKLGILLQNDNSPIGGGNIDIISTNQVYKGFLSNGSSGVLIGTGEVLYRLNPIHSCKRIQEVTETSQNGIYTINPLGSGGKEVYCDMQTDGGGWTLVGRSVLSGSGNMGWKISFGDVKNDAIPYSFDTTNLRFNEILFGDYAHSKQWGDYIYKKYLGKDFLNSYESDSAAFCSATHYDVKVMKGSCLSQDILMFRCLGSTNRNTNFFIRDVVGNPEMYGLFPTGYKLFHVYNGDCRSGMLGAKQGMIFVR